MGNFFSGSYSSNKAKKYFFFALGGHIALHDLDMRSKGQV